MFEEYFDSDAQVSEFLTALLGRSEIPLKFEYLRDGAKKWSKLVNSSGYALGNLEKAFLREKIAAVVSATGKCNVFDIGCGEGSKAAIVLKEFVKRHGGTKYIAVDISKEMIGLALKKARQVRRIAPRYFVRDFEAGNLSSISCQYKHDPNLFLFLGNTLGNCWDKSRVLTNLRESMTFKDFLLIGVELADNRRVHELLRHYRNKTIYDIQANTLQSMGISLRDGTFDVCFDKSKSQVETRFVLNKTAVFELGDKKVQLKKGRKILLMLSYKVTKESLECLLSQIGFKLLAFYTDKSNSYAFALAKAVKF